MSAPVEWVQQNPFYWSGPQGWTICRIVMGNSERYELWRTLGEKSGLVGAGKSLQEAQDLYLLNHKSPVQARPCDGFAR